MGDLPSAQMMVEYYSKQLLYVRTCPVFVQYSNHAQLKLEADGQVSWAGCTDCQWFQRRKDAMATNC